MDDAIALAFDLEVATTLDEERRRERMEAEKRQLEILAAASGLALAHQTIGMLGE